MAPERKKRLLRNLLLDRRFQLKYTLIMVLLTTAICTGLGISLYRAHRESSQVNSLGDVQIDSEIEAKLREEDGKVLLSLVGLLSILVISVTAVGIYATHKIAGPAYAMRRTLKSVTDGRLIMPIGLRKGDELRDVAHEIQRMIETLREREADEAEKLSRIAAQIQNLPSVPEDAVEWLEELIRDKKKRLADEPDPGPPQKESD